MGGGGPDVGHRHFHSVSLVTIFLFLFLPNSVVNSIKFDEC